MSFNLLPGFLRPASSISRKVTKARASASLRMPVPGIEPLESRTLLSGTVGITPVIVSSNVPSQVIGGAKLRSTIKLDLTDSLSTPEQGFTVNIYAGLTPTFDTSVDTLVTGVIRSNTIRSTHTVPLSIPITGLPTTLPNGSYYLIAETVDRAGNIESTATNTTVTLSAPHIAFTESVTSTLPPSLVSGSTIKGTVKVAITNNGNITATGVTSINVTASTVPGQGGLSVAMLSKRVNIPVGKTVTVTVPVKTLPVLADGTYYLVAEVTDPDGAVTLGTSPSLTIAAPNIQLTGTIASIANVRSGATVIVTNGGNVADLTQLHGTFGLALNPDGTDPVGSTVTLTSPKLDIKVGKTVMFHVKPTKAFLSSLTVGIPYYLTVTFTDNTGNMGSAISPNSFTI